MQFNQLDPAFLRQQIIGVDAFIDTPFGRRLLSYADYTASGRGLHFIEDYLKQLLRLYANSHTEDDTTGCGTTHLLHEAERQIKTAVNAGPAGRIIACGSGATAAIDRMQQLVGVKLPGATRALHDALLNAFIGEGRAAAFSDHCRRHQPVVFVGPYEHHSNEVSWRESLATVVEVRLDGDGGIDLHHLESLLQAPEYGDRLRIGSFSAASNVTGMRTPVTAIARLLHRYDAFAFFDYAASAPYVAIDMNPDAADGEGEAAIDAVFISPHKFLGGPGASGILVFNERCYHPELPPSMAGGGTVDYVGPEDHDFIRDIETRENAGTPGILQTLKAALALAVKDAVGTDIIEAREAEMVRQAFARWGMHPAIEILGNPDPARRIGIVSFNIKGRNGRYLHPRFVTRLLNDLFGLQTRAGCSCAGPYGHKLLGIDDETAREYRSVIAEGHSGIKPGWCRISFHYVFDQPEVEYLLDCVELVADHGYLFTPLYDFAADNGLWRHKQWREDPPELSLEAALAAAPSAPDSLSIEARMRHYRENLASTRSLALDLERSYREDDVRLSGEEGELQFFQLPKASVLDPLR